MEPSMGRIVHYKDEDGSYPAIVISVNANKTTNLTVFKEDGGFGYRKSVPLFDTVDSNQEQPVNTWVWPPRV